MPDCVWQTPGEKPLRSCIWTHRLCILDTRAASCLPFVTLSVTRFLSSPLPASSFATSSPQIEIKFKDKEEFEQWLTAFACRDQEKAVDQLASVCHRYTVLNFVNCKGER